MGCRKAQRRGWWQSRPTGPFGTVGFRSCDVQRSLARTRMLVALCQAICHRALRDLAAGVLVQDLEMEYLNDAVWKATRFGFEARVADPFDEQIITMAEMVARMVEYVRPSLEELETADIIPVVETVLRKGSEAQEQLGEYESNGFEGLKRMLMD